MMNRASRLFLFAALLFCLLGPRGFALDVDGVAPTISDSSLQGLLNIAFGLIKSDIGSDILGIKDSPRKLIRSFADASVFAVTGASQRGYEGYKYFAFTIGPVMGVRLPGAKIDITDEFADLGDKLKTEGDMGMGLNVQAVTGQISVNTSPFLVKDLYLGFRFGFFNFNSVENLTFKTVHLGIVGNYQLVRGLDIGSVAWRGVSFGSGFILQQTNLEYRYALDTRRTIFNPGPQAGILELRPELVFDMHIDTYVVPIEVNTAFQILVFNINLGLGLDFAFGSNSTNINMVSEVDVWDTAGDDFYMVSPGSLTVDAGGSYAPTVANPKLMMGLGLKFGPLILDIPFTYYFLAGRRGFTIGITAGIVW
jgi:hypothetical protein